MAIDPVFLMWIDQYRRQCVNVCTYSAWKKRYHWLKHAHGMAHFHISPCIFSAKNPFIHMIYFENWFYFVAGKKMLWFLDQISDIIR